MFGISLGSLARISARIAFTLTILLSAAAQAQGLVGSWSQSGILISFQSSGRWVITVSDPVNAAECGGYVSVGGSYTTGSGNSVSVSLDSGTCGSQSASMPSSILGSGTYTNSANTLVLHLQGPYGPFDFNLSGNVTRATPLPPPQVAQSVYVAKDGKIPETAVAVTRAGTFGNAILKVNLSLSATGFAATPAYNVYVMAIVPGTLLGSPSPVIFVKAKKPGDWGPLKTPLASFLENAAEGSADNKVLIEILTDNDISTLAGTEFYVGYGTSGDEMIAAKRYRGVYKAQ